MASSSSSLSSLYSEDNDMSTAPLASTEPTTRHDPISDGGNDIAKTFSLERMSVQAPGRIPFQMVYLWMTANEDKGKAKKTATNFQYDVSKDGPANGGTERLPQPEELIYHAAAKEYLEVGLVVGSNPAIYRPHGQSRDGTGEAARKSRGILPRDPAAMRVFIPATEDVAASARCYVGCHRTMGYLSPRAVPGSDAFFYAEFWNGISDDMISKDRIARLAQNCRQYAASTKSPATSSAAFGSVTDLDEWTPANPLLTSPALKQSTGWGTGGRDNLRSMLPAFEEASPDLRYDPRTTEEGVGAFYNFDHDLSAEDAQTVMNEVKRAMPHSPKLSSSFVMDVHRLLKNSDLGDSIPSNSLGFFLEACYELWRCKHNVEKMDVIAVIGIVNIHKRHLQYSTSS